MKKLTFLGLLLLVTINYLFADEYISDKYFEEVSAESEILHESMKLLPIAKTVEEEAREKAKNNHMIKKETVLTSIREATPQVIVEPVSNADNKEEIITPAILEKKQSIQANTYLTALKQARNESKIIMLTIGSTDCKYCDEMEVSTLSDSGVKDAIEANFLKINYNQDVEPLPLGLQEGMTPNFIFVNTNEDIMNMYPGMRTPEEFKEVLEQILSM